MLLYLKSILIKSWEGSSEGENEALLLFNIYIIKENHRCIIITLLHSNFCMNELRANFKL